MKCWPFTAPGHDLTELLDSISHHFPQLPLASAVSSSEAPKGQGFHRRPSTGKGAGRFQRLRGGDEFGDPSGVVTVGFHKLGNCTTNSWMVFVNGKVPRQMDDDLSPWNFL